MKKLLTVIIFLVSLSSFAFAAQAQTQTVKESLLPQGMPETISLLDTTPLFPKPDDKLKSWASLRPQEVKVVRTQFGDSGYANPSGHTWIEIHTAWLGDMWIEEDNSKIGVIRPFDADLNLAVETPLYDHPYREAANGARLSTQTVHAKAEFVSPSGFNAIQIETSWLGDQWLLQPQIKNGAAETLSFPDAISPDYGSLMTINDIHIIKLGGSTFIQGQLVLQKEAWNVGRIKLSLGEYMVSGELSFWNKSGDVIAQAPYAVYTHAGQNLTAPILLPVDQDLSSAVIATLQDTFPLYISLPLPPLLNLTDPEGKVLLGILRQQQTGDYSVAKAWISGKLPGSHDYKLTLTFYSNDNRIIGTAHVHQRLNGPLTPDQAAPEGGGANDLIDMVGKGDWTNYYQVDIHIDQVSD